ncbi:MAG: hypothetical protein COZ37_03885 [bacterium (Candidatus Ratteibacteria) CG_4_10_14_3_um_filter_41_18]|uniref:DUF1318 domain-containing protein n=4 Tax=Candidatus Ratteibacteria TaxID=2979319 RepID=A0A2M7E8C7_9BACT|nr:MAG: hypothetical protein AUJ76_04775 [Candidatus Omnitrophica bacterium CG1_02_41_171]PIV63964.1 MAG: hypothetical protein COS11_04560 [bacterium (Candidatus Ratteibacteria) CG01_land_8_20_14_3_00_40_19]PIW33991.1 MAG: hypothetical protein COW28_01650 [bacterium (Candidatus Ratteibacteria) CG15_BIG_FIL_POST_REV_8_21_14_020_41_12]PIW73760.1 MAG: hypothetical protein CO004_04265 [bacterium (Candidatus Ratteibacteria) CG_4_8_14_3_um_filter_41_36]PIX77208.1 MAG: hypothetical protein COZ37_03885
MKKFLSIIPGIAIIFLLINCATVNVYVTFPQEKIKDAAIDIENQLEEGGKSFNFNPFASGLLYAETITPELKVHTPEIEKALASRKARFPQIKEYKRQGVIGENNEGLLEIRGNAEIQVQRLVKEENKDRMTIYQTLVQQNNMSPGQLKVIQEQFAATRRKRAKKGEWIQLPDGDWTQKG